MFEPVTQCRCCGGEQLLRYLDLGNQPLANSYWKESPPAERIPLQVDFCRHCSHSQLSVVVQPELMFRNYLYVSGTTRTFRRHQRELAVEAVRRVQREESHYLRVLDIGANDGAQLEEFRALGCSVFGVDPAENLRAYAAEKGIPGEVAYWSQEYAQDLASRQVPFDLITATNVFAHVADPAGFLLGCRSVLAFNGRVVIEFPYGKTTLEQGEFDQIYHEHLSYFTAGSFLTLATRVGFQVEDAVETPIHGGSIRFYLRDRWYESSQVAPKLQELMLAEARRGLLDPGTYTGFQERVDRTGEQLRQAMFFARGTGQRLVGYGASAKGNTMMNYFGVRPERMVDDNPLKWGHYTPGRNVPIDSPEWLRTIEEPVCFLLTAWNFREEIAEKIRALRGEGRGDTLLTYVPEVAVHAL